MARPPLLTNEQILARARPVFRDRGYAAGTKEIAAAVGLTWGAIALRFGDKETLFRQAMDPRANARVLHRKLDGAAGLPGLLQDLLAHLWETWPLRLQSRIAPARPAIPDEPQTLAQDLESAFGTLAAQGEIRRDMSPQALAELVLSIATGEVVQRFLARERVLVPNPAFVNGVSRLLAGAHPSNTSERPVSVRFPLGQQQRPSSRPAEGS